MNIELDSSSTNNVTNYYSIDNGTNWNEYTGSFETTSTNIQTKSVDDTGKSTEISKKEITSDETISLTSEKESEYAEIASGYLGVLPYKACDNDDTTYAVATQIGTNTCYYLLNVDETMENKTMRVLTQGISGAYCGVQIDAILGDGTTSTLINSLPTDTRITIPVNTKQLKIYVQ